MKKRSFVLILLLTLTAILVCAFMTSCTVNLFRPATDSEDTTTSDVSDSPETEADTGVYVPFVSDSETDAETTVPPEPDVRTASFIGAGDVIIYYGNVRDAKSCAVDGGREYNFAPMFANVKDRISAADIAFVNQETLMCGEGYAFSYWPHFNGPQDLGYDLAEAGFDVINIANNHMLDKRAAGLSATIDFYDTLDGITMIGGYKDRADYENIRVVETNGIRVAFLSYAEWTNGIVLDAGSPIVIPYPDEDKIPDEIARAKEIADFVIVSVHWGSENTFTPNDYQKNLARLFAESGADAIIGHHPHVIQPVEWIEREDGTRTLCVYSLGNFIAEQEYDFQMLGGMISFDMLLTDGSPSIENVQFIPTVYYFNISFYKNQVYYLKDFTDALASSHGLPYYGRTLYLQNLKNYLANTISSEFLTEYLGETQTYDEQ